MLYLFLTGRRAAYLNDIFSVLHLPKRASYDIKYKISGDINLIHPSAEKESLEQHGKDIDVLIVFDNFCGEYIPLRLGKYKEIVDEEKQRYYSVELLDYCHKEDNNEFNKFLDEISNKKIRHYLNQDINEEERNRRSEGILAFYNDRDARTSEKIKVTENSWRETVGQLAKQEKFKNIYSVFTRIEIEKVRRREDEIEYDEDGAIILYSDKQYKIHLVYYIPDFNKMPMNTIPIKFYQSSDNIGLMENSNQMVSEQNKIDIYCNPYCESIRVEKKAEIWYRVLEDKITVEESDESTSKKIWNAVAPVEIKIKNRLPIAVRVGLILVCVGILGLPDLSKMNNWEQVCDILKMIVAFADLDSVKALVTVALIWLIGKPRLDD